MIVDKVCVGVVLAGALAIGAIVYFKDSLFVGLGVPDVHSFKAQPYSELEEQAGLACLVRGGIALYCFSAPSNSFVTTIACGEVGECKGME